MSSPLETVFEIAGVGTTLLFIALTGLVGLMYLLTSPWLHDRLSPSVADAPAEAAKSEARVREAAEQARREAEAETARQQRAVALAVAVACATAERPLIRAVETPSAWRRLHRTRRFAQPRRRPGTRT